MLVGLNDMLGDMGLAGQYDHPKVREIYQTVIDACRKHGKHCGVGGLASRPDLMAEYVRMGARYVSTGTDLGVPARRRDGAGEADQGHQALMAEPQSTSGLVYASAVAADAFARSLLQAHGVPPEDAATIAGCLVSADLRGVDTHGLCRLPIYLERVRARPDQSASPISSPIA